MKKNNYKITFFENIYYWLWYFLSIVPKGWRSPPRFFASQLVSLLKTLNFFCLFLFLCFILNINLLTLIPSTLISKNTFLLPILILIAIGFSLMWSDLKKYEEKADQIAGKFELLSSNERFSKKVIFLTYIIITIYLFSSSQPMIDSFLNK